MSYNGVWTLAEAGEGQVKTVSYELLARGRKLADKLGAPLISVLIGYPIKEENLRELIERGAESPARFSPRPGKL
jgi:electron transfer flavoprotein alpha subunit